MFKSLEFSPWKGGVEWPLRVRPPLMTNQTPNHEQIEAVARRIIVYYIDSAGEKNADYLIGYLGGGMIPAAAVEVLRPILQSLVDENCEFGSALTGADFTALERLSGEVETLYTKRAVTLKLVKEAINTPQWSEVEQAHAARLHLKLLPAGDRSLHLLAHEIALSDFSAEKIISTLHNDAASVTAFSRQWYVDCNKFDYGEEWDPAEGSQQERNPPEKLLGIGQGFLVSYIILYLYAANAPDGLVEFYKRRKMPHGRKVAKDVLRVYRQTTTRKS